MSQAQVLPTPSLSLPQLAYKGIPVVTTEKLAQAYEVQPHQIRQNFKNNKEHFVESKHFFSLSGNDLREFKNCVENFYSVQIDKRTPSLTLWTERGAARHAKNAKLSIERGICLSFWKKRSSVRPRPEPVPAPFPHLQAYRSRSARRLTAIINTWVGMAPIHYASARAQVNAHFGVTSVDALTVAQVKEAIQWVQAKIDALPAVPVSRAVPPALPCLFNVYARPGEGAGTP